MGRPKKDGVFINYYIDREIKEMLDEYCEDVGQTSTLAVERILRAHLEKYKKEKESKKQDTRMCPSRSMSTVEPTYSRKQNV